MLSGDQWRRNMVCFVERYLRSLIGIVTVYITCRKYNIVRKKFWKF